MLIQPLSDLHNELRADGQPPIPLVDTGADVIVLAGDIDQGCEGVRWAAEEAARLATPLLYVAGNHEHYGRDLGANLRALRRTARGTGVHFLENDRLDLGGVRFLGCTLWTDYRASAGLDHADAMEVAGGRLPDHRLIRSRGTLFSPALALRRHQDSVRWLRRELAWPFAGPKVVITHHGPSALCGHPQFSPGSLDGAFFSPLDDLVARADVWIFGHTHVSLDTHIGACRLVSNQRGYRDESSDFDERKQVAIARP